ncbi:MULTISPECIES: sigma 54-interacting transcriptional regulator [unclassified Pseudodesulfovibrio]|uniref:sigma 54-interacting transcriptional regulator n=1 Tax=unclassified Pseudodesulfovibrio TaxID=2661612 RepID=UPI000FEB94C5|nr:MULTISPECIES: sigma 54-interacting transcriptional regulator [unclassified Pseudodesulfovibrio]MCJ2163473.1 sigma 54-interacting transcriptional regulator [Pseudodesulfovibrio sp. S3-i]RWU06709.1 GAF domain-containing protein [Pseudodesulfovibrio sp. S3]
MHSNVHGLKLSALLAICQVIDRAMDLVSALDGVLQILSEQLSMQRATVTLFDPETGQLSINASYGLNTEEKQRGVYRLDEGVTGRIFQTGEPYYVPDIDKEPLFLDKTGSRRVKRGMISFIGVPIVLHGDPIGVLNVDRLFEDEVSFDEDVDFLKVVATLIGQFISLNEKIKAREAALKRENTSLKYQISKNSKGPYIVGYSAAMVEVQRQMEKVSPTRATVLLLGESGVGKTLIARIIHELSERKGNPFIKINCASIPSNLLESELFGHEKGAFTGATGTRPGRFEEADTGTIFLDEIGELPMELQAKLLRVLQDKELERLGSNRTRTIDVRILAATNRDLGHLVERGRFRLDLYYRLNVFPVRVPPLRERKEDITGLLNHFLSKMAEDYGRNIHLTSTALDALIRYDWPGNVREMQNLIERLVIMSEEDRISLEFLKSYLTPGQTAAVQEALPLSENVPCHASLKEFERNEVMAALERNGWIQYKAAVALGLSARQMGYRVKKYGLESMIADGRAKLRRIKETQI